MRKGISMLLAVLFCLNLFAQTKPSKGDGSVDSPYQIADAQEMLWFANLVNGTLADEPKDSLVCAELTADIDLSEVCGEEIQIVPDFEPEIENSISDVLSDVADQIDPERVNKDDFFLLSASTNILSVMIFQVKIVVFATLAKMNCGME